ncbi:MAG: TIGR01620 family protein [Hyphomicrobiaceae bacterium]
MTKPPPRRPQAFDADDPAVRPTDDTASGDPADTVSRPPCPDISGHPSTTTDDEPSADTDENTSQQPAPPERPPRFGFLGIFVSAVLALSSLAIGLWFSRFVSIAVARDDWIGWTAQGLALIIAAILIIVLLREVMGYFRLARLGRLRREAEQALATGDLKAEQRVVRHLKGLASARPQFRWALAKFRDSERHQSGPGQLLALADRVLLGDADKEARRVIYESARRVAVVTAVVPIAFIAVLFVLFENIRMVRRLAGTYGGRPGMLAGSRLLIRVIFHIAATGAVALTDDLFGQFLGQDMMRRLSARLGEGAFNGALTARLGIVAIELCRPCPYIEAKPLRARHVVSELFPEFNAGDLIGRAVGRKPKEPPEGV